jgi:hypothetical protein
MSDPVAAAVAAFTAEAERRYRGDLPQVIRVVDDPALAVPGFVTLEARAGSAALRAWVREGTMVLAARHNFAPVLEALRVRDETASPSPDQLADMFVWLHGPEFSRIDFVHTGYRGAAEDFEVPPLRYLLADDTVELWFSLDMENEDPRAAAVLRYQLLAHPDGTYQVHLHQLAP